MFPTTPLQLYRMPISGHCHRVELMLSLLGLPYELIDVNLLRGEHQRAEFLALNPLGQVPTFFTDDGQVLYDSRVICEYLNALGGGARFAGPAGSVRRRR